MKALADNRDFLCMWEERNNIQANFYEFEFRVNL